MSLDFRFAIASDLHIGLPHTLPSQPRFHRVEISIPNFNYVMEQLQRLDIDFLLIPGDLTQNGEPENHEWLSQALAQLPFPSYVIPGNHDALTRHRTRPSTGQVPGDATEPDSIGLDEFSTYYKKFGYGDTDEVYYTCQPLPGLRLIGLNSIFFGDDNQQHYTGYIDEAQLAWLRGVLADATAGRSQEQIFVMVHHNVLEHLPNQSTSKLGRRYMLENAAELLDILQAAGVQLIFTGHLHIQDIAYQPLGQLFDVTTGSLVSYPHPYRILRYREVDAGVAQLSIESHRIPSAPGWADLQRQSRDFISEHSTRFIYRLLTDPPLNRTEAEAEALLSHFRYFWADVANGDAQFDFAELPQPVQRFFEAFSAEQTWDNDAALTLRSPLVRMGEPVA